MRKVKQVKHLREDFTPDNVTIIIIVIVAILDILVVKSAI